MISRIDAVHRRVSGAQRDLFLLLAEIDGCEVWRDAGARDMAHWLAMRYGISHWKARRWIAAAHALPDLPRISEALSDGELGIDKVVQLTRFATPEAEAYLLRWARGVSCGAIRRKGDLAIRAAVDDVIEVERSRSLSWWYFDEGRCFGLEAELPAAQGAVVAKALDRLADLLPAMPGEEDASHADARRADAFVALCSERRRRFRSGSCVDRDPRPAGHADDGRRRTRGGRRAAHASRDAQACALQRRVQAVIEDRNGAVVGLRRISREPPGWMLRQVRYRDKECRFPGCGARRFTQAHHIEWWRDGGRTDLQNLLIICSFHHKLVHEYGWRVKRERDGSVRRFRPDGVRYRAGPSRAVAA